MEFSIMVAHWYIGFRSWSILYFQIRDVLSTPFPKGILGLFLLEF